MKTEKAGKKIRNILCPTDLSPKSQRALGFAARMAETLGSQLTACHCAPASWFSSVNRLPENQVAEIKSFMNEQIRRCRGSEALLRRRTFVVENSFDPARDILNMISETGTDLVVMKARPGVLSALHFGSIVERVINGAGCPVLLLPSGYLAGHDPASDQPEFRRILFDYDFSFATDELLKTVHVLTHGCESELHMLSVLEPSRAVSREIAFAGKSPVRLEAAVREKLNAAVRGEGKPLTAVAPAVEWGSRAETILRYAKRHNIDLICTTMAKPNMYVEKLYSVYLGSLLRSTGCPILIRQSA